MHTAWMRLNSLVFFASCCIAAISVGLNLSPYLQTQEPISFDTLKLDQVHRFIPTRRQDTVIFSFDMSYDLRPAFTWNVKHMFVAVVAEYETSKHKFNQVVIHDRIVKSKDEAFLDLSNLMVKYPLEDVKTDLRGKEVTFALMWDVMPYVGFTDIHMERSVTNTIKLPKEYIRK